MNPFLQVEIRRREILRPRELLLVIARQGDYIYLDYEKRGMGLSLRFFEDDLHYGEESVDCAARIMMEKGFCFSKLEYLGPIYEIQGIYDKIYVFLASGVENYRSGSFLSLTFVEMVEALKSRLFTSSRSEEAVRLYLKYLRDFG